jgi:hypothetical protein
MNVDVNWLAVVVAAGINMVIGALWYSPVLFAKPWTKLVGKKMEDLQGNAGPGYGVAVVGALLQAYILRHFVAFAAGAYPTYSDVMIGFLTGLWLWLGFVAVVGAVNTVFAGRPWKLWAIDTGYFLVVLVANGILLSVWH